MNRLPQHAEIATGPVAIATSKASLLQQGWEFLRDAACDTVWRAANAPLLHPRCCRADRGPGGARWP